VVGECSIGSCKKSAYERGLCSKHWQAARAGSVKEYAERGSLPEFLEAAVKSQVDECVVWPFAKRKYSYGLPINAFGSKRPHVIVCEAVNGPAPEGKEAAHRCGNESCVNPRHLRWATHKENGEDRVEHTRAQRLKLEIENQRAIRRRGTPDNVLERAAIQSLIDRGDY